MLYSVELSHVLRREKPLEHAGVGAVVPEDANVR